MALNDARHDEAADHFTDAINSGVLSDERLINPEYEIFVIVCLYPFNKHDTFDTQLWTFTAVWVGARILVASCTPESVLRIPSSG